MIRPPDDDLLTALRAIQLYRLLRDPAELIDEGAEALERYANFARLIKTDTIQILMEVLAPVGRVLHDALNKQVYLETILLKAMREAHAVRIDDLLTRLNQLRTAGELTFLEQLPTEIKQQPQVIVIEKTATAPVAAESEKKTAPVIEETAPVIEETAPVIEETAPVIEETAPEIEETAPEIEETAPEIEETAPEEISIPVGMDQLEETIVSGLPELPPAPQAEQNNLKPDQKQRKSIANSDPAALDEAAKDPQIHEILDLFDGVIVDIHK